MADKPGQQLVDAVNLPMRIASAFGVKPKSTASDSSTNMNWKPTANAEQQAEIARSQSGTKPAVKAAAPAEHPLTPRTSQRAQNRRAGTAAEYKK